MQDPDSGGTFCRAAPLARIEAKEIAFQEEPAMRTIDKPAAALAAVLAVFMAAFVLAGAGASRPAASVRADATTTTVCPFNMSWDGVGCR
jgi:hypothetical protein